MKYSQEAQRLVREFESNRWPVGSANHLLWIGEVIGLLHMVADETTLNCPECHTPNAVCAGCGAWRRAETDRPHFFLNDCPHTQFRTYTAGDPFFECINCGAIKLARDGDNGEWKHG